MAGGTDPWLREAAIQALSGSGDPRAREYLRTALQDPALPEQLRVGVIRGLGREYATGRDLELLRTRYAGLSSTTAKQAVLSVLGDQGGGANLQWLLGIAADAGEPSELRARAVEAGTVTSNAEPASIATTGRAFQRLLVIKMFLTPYLLPSLQFLHVFRVHRFGTAQDGVQGELTLVGKLAQERVFAGHETLHAAAVGAWKFFDVLAWP